MQGQPLSPQEKQKFLAKLRTTHGNVSRAAQAAGISRSVAYDHKKSDTDFSEAWENVIASVYDEAEQELFRRAVTGWKRHKDGPKEKSDRLLEFMLKGNRAEKFRERLDLNAHHTGTLDHNIQFTIDKIYSDDANTDAIDVEDPEAAGPAIDAGIDPAGEE